MHYKDGQEAKAGDLVLNTEGLSETSGRQLVGILTTGTSTATTFNGGITPVVSRYKSSLGWSPWQPILGPSGWTVTLSECEKIDGLPEPAAQPVAEAENKEAVSAA
jgi:hypothetical protein